VGVNIEVPYRMRVARSWFPRDKNLRILDFGCGNANFLRFLLNTKYKLYGCDPKDLKLNENDSLKERLVFKKIKINQKLPFENNFFDVVVALEVIEHVGKEKKLIGFIREVSKKGSTLIISIPNKGFLSFLDKGNLKYRFPTIHRILYTLIYGKDLYKKDFISNKVMFGDVTRFEKQYHKHYNLQEIRDILTNNYKLIDYRYYGLFADLLNYLQELFYLIFKRQSNVINLLRNIDAKIFQFRYSYGLIIKAKAI